MTPRIFQALVGAGLILGLLAGAALWQESCAKTAGSYAEQQAHVAKGEGNTHEAQARAKDAEIQDLQAKLQDREKALGRVAAERGALLRRLEAERAARVDSAGPAQPLPDVRDEVIAKDAEVIEAQAEELATCKQALQVALARGDEWKATAEARERQALAQAAATEAWKKAVVAAEWRGGLKGLALGAVLGFVGGRR